MQFNDFVLDSKIHRVSYRAAFDRVLNSGWYILGGEVSSFEAEFAQYLGVKHAIGVANGLEALQIALMSLGISTGDEVITTPVSAVATTLSIIAVGATPVFADVDQNGLIDANQIESLITNRTKAILPVHLYGNPCNLDIINKLCKQHNISLIEDAAQAQGSMFASKKLGTHGDIGCFSFYPTKNLGTIGGDAGAIVTNNDGIAKIISELRNYGEQGKYNHVRYGLNSRLDEIHAAILREKLKWLDESNNARKYNANIYNERLSKIKELYIVSNNNESNIHQYVIKTKARNSLKNHLSSKNIPTLIHYPKAIHMQPFYLDRYPMQRFELAEEFCNTTLSLPCHELLTNDDVDSVCSTIEEFFR